VSNSCARLRPFGDSRKIPRVSRRFAAVLLAGLVASSIVAYAQSAKVARIGVVSAEPPNDAPCVERLRRGLAEIGYIEGKSYVLEPRWANERLELIPSLAAELVRMKVDLIVSASGPAALAVKEATSSIPIVLASSFYPVELGVIASLARPGGNVTGVTHFTPELMAKRVQLLKDLLPRATRFAVIRLPGGMQDLIVRDMERAARELTVQLQMVEVRSADDLPAAFETVAGSHAQAVMTTQSPLFVHNNVRIAQLARKHRLPSLSGEPNAADDGALLFYGPNIFEGCSRAAKYIDRILKGARPADLPVEQPTKIDFVINLKTARELGITVPPALLERADRVVQ